MFMYLLSAFDNFGLNLPVKHPIATFFQSFSLGD